MVANGIMSMDSTETVPSSFGSSGGETKSYRRAMMDRERAMDQALHANRSKFGQAILSDNLTEQRKLEQRLKRLENERKLSKFRLEHSSRMIADEHYPQLTSNLTKTAYTLKPRSRNSPALPQEVQIIERAPTNMSLRGRIETPEIVPDVKLYTVKEGETSLFRIHPTKRTLKRATSVESVEMRSQLKELEKVIFQKDTLRKDALIQGLEDSLGKDQDKFRVQMLRTGTPKFRNRDKNSNELDGRLPRSLDAEGDMRRAQKAELDTILATYPFKKSYLRKKQELDAIA